MDEEAPEKTLAMNSPTFKEGEAPPSPISVPPAAAPTVPEAPLPNIGKPGTSPVPFPPASAGPRPAPRGVIGAPRGASPATGPGSGGLPLKRPQTVIGLAPPPATGGGAGNAPVRPAAGKPPSGDPLFGIDEAAGEAARAAIAPVRRSPLASTGFAKPQAQPKPIPAAIPRAAPAIPNLADPIGDEEATRAVPREELMRGDPDHVVLGEDHGAHGEEATLAVAPSSNAAANHSFAAFAATMHRTPEELMPPPGQGMPPSQQHPPQPSWNDPPQWTPPPGSMGPGMPMPDPNAWHQQGSMGPGMPAYQQQYSHQPQQPMMMNPSHMPSHVANAMSVVPHSQQMHGQPIPYPGQSSMMPHQQQGLPPPPWAQQQREPIKISGQIILLAVVGVICLAIFITGIVLFATTKF